MNFDEIQKLLKDLKFRIVLETIRSRDLGTNRMRWMHRAYLISKNNFANRIFLVEEVSKNGVTSSLKKSIFYGESFTLMTKITENIRSAGRSASFTIQNKYRFEYDGAKLILQKISKQKNS